MKFVNEVLSVILSRRSVRAYCIEPISADILSAILEAGQAAPYVVPDSRHFTVIQDRQIIDRLNLSAKEAGKNLGDEMLTKMCENPAFDGTYGAPAVVVLSGNENTVQYEGVCAASVQSMLIAAESLSLASCWAYFPIFAFHGAENEKWREELRIPAGYKPCASVLLGRGSEKSKSDVDERYKNLITYIDAER